MGKKRNLQRKFKELCRLFPVVAIIGPRQSGKSTFVKETYPSWKYYDLENPADYELITKDPSTFFSLNAEKVIIDEAQQFPDLFKVLRGVIDSDRSKKGRFVLTGSSSPEIVKGLSESLAGRLATIEMWPFKINEFYEEKSSPFYELLTQKKVDQKEIVNLTTRFDLNQTFKMWYWGGFPEPSIEKDRNPHFYKQWMENYIANYVSRDIRGLFPKLNIHNFRRFLGLLASFSGHQLNMSEMARSLEVNSTTIKDYLDIIHQTFIWRNLSPFEKNPLKKIQKSKKGFFRDQGLLHYFLKIQSLDDLLIHPIAGFSFESFVIEEIIRGLQSTLATQIEYNYYRTVDKSEVDLIIDGPFGIIPIEIKLGSSTPKRLLKGLENFIEDMKLPLGFLINSSQRIEKITDKIIQIPVHYL